ncbi:SMI1/KNR4 family protein [Chryseobacterium sp. c4a]|uniref:SMI1/KNR4 family protein n=1 Tax=Chryseobacterium sp. c4a TaxID=1573582 RepID=UPI0013569D52|nr:SMI1/KNR4 family protein [Chryseobacterium sp. c4a]
MKWKGVKKLKRSHSIIQVENVFGKKLPPEYKTLILICNNGYPEPNLLNLQDKKGKVFGELLNFNLDEKGNILEHYSWMKDKLPLNVFPITITPGGDYLCYNYQENSASPTIVYWDHEQNSDIINDERIISENQKYNLDFVANTIVELLSQLNENDTDEIDTGDVVTLWEDFLNEEELKKLSDKDLEEVNYRRARQGWAPIEK